MEANHKLALGTHYCDEPDIGLKRLLISLVLSLDLRGSLSIRRPSGFSWRYVL